TFRNEGLAPTPPLGEQKARLRTLVKEIIVTVHKAQPRAHLTLRWRGGALIELDLELPRSSSRGEAQQSCAIVGAGSSSTAASSKGRTRTRSPSGPRTMAKTVFAGDAGDA